MNTVAETRQNLSVREDDYCFVWGAENPVGLKLESRVVDGRVETFFVPAPEHQGFAGIIHGGLVRLVLDELTLHTNEAPIHLRDLAEANVTEIRDGLGEGGRLTCGGFMAVFVTARGDGIVMKTAAQNHDRTEVQ